MANQMYVYTEKKLKKKKNKGEKTITRQLDFISSKNERNEAFRSTLIRLLAFEKVF